MNDDYDNDIPPLPKADDTSYSEAVMNVKPRKVKPAATVDELIQAMRLSGSLSEIRKKLEKLIEKDPASYNAICRFYGK